MASSTFARLPGQTELWPDDVPVPMASSTVDPRIREIDRKRAIKKIPHIELCARARIHPTNWHRLRAGTHQPNDATLARLGRAVEGVSRHLASVQSVVVAFVRAAEAVIGAQAQKTPGLVAALTFARERNAPPATIARARLRRFAIYLAAVELEVGNAEIARALATTRQNVHQARNAVEDLRGRPAVDALLEHCRALLKGEGG